MITFLRKDNDLLKYQKCYMLYLENYLLKVEPGIIIEPFSDLHIKGNKIFIRFVQQTKLKLIEMSRPKCQKSDI
jgi:hypothetical protein